MQQFRRSAGLGTPAPPVHCRVMLPYVNKTVWPRLLICFFASLLLLLGKFNFLDRERVLLLVVNVRGLLGVLSKGPEWFIKGMKVQMVCSGGLLSVVLSADTLAIDCCRSLRLLLLTMPLLPSCMLASLEITRNWRGHIDFLLCDQFLCLTFPIPKGGSCL